MELKWETMKVFLLSVTTELFLRNKLEGPLIKFQEAAHKTKSSLEINTISYIAFEFFLVLKISLCNINAFDLYYE